MSMKFYNLAIRGGGQNNNLRWMPQYAKICKKNSPQWYDHASEATATEPVSVELLLIMTIMTIIGEVGENRG